VHGIDGADVAPVPANADDIGTLPDAALAPALEALRDALQRALVEAGVSFTLAAASRRFGVCAQVAGADGGTFINAQGLGLAAWSLRCQQPTHVPVLGADTRAAEGVDYSCERSEADLPAVSVAIGECMLSGVTVWLAISARGVGLAHPNAAVAMQSLLAALLRGLTAEAIAPLDGRRARLFRATAFAAQRDDNQTLPLQLLLAPTWARRSGQTLAALLVLVVAAMFVPIRDRYGTPAVLRLDGTTTINASQPARVARVFAVPGQHLAFGAPLLRLRDAASGTPVTLRAERSGRVLDLATSRGQAVVAGDPLLQFAPDDSVMQLDFELPIGVAAQLHPGATGVVRLATAPDQEFAIRLIWLAQVVAPASTDGTQRVRARAAFTVAPPTVLPGSSAELRIDLGIEPLYRLLARRWRGG
jgi:hypothetical protein